MAAACCCRSAAGEPGRRSAANQPACQGSRLWQQALLHPVTMNSTYARLGTAWAAVLPAAGFELQPGCSFPQYQEDGRRAAKQRVAARRAASIRHERVREKQGRLPKPLLPASPVRHARTDRAGTVSASRWQFVHASPAMKGVEANAEQQPSVSTALGPPTHIPVPQRPALACVHRLKLAVCGTFELVILEGTVISGWH